MAKVKEATENGSLIGTVEAKTGRRKNLGNEGIYDAIMFTDNDNVLHQGTIVKLGTGEEILNGQAVATRTMLIEFTDSEENTKFAQLVQRATSPDGTAVDWARTYCSALDTRVGDLEDFR